MNLGENTQATEQAAQPALLWRIQRKPSMAASMPIYIVAIILLIGGGIFGAMIHLEREPWFGLGVGAIMAALLVVGARRGTVITIDEQGFLTLNFGARDNLRLHLDLIEDATMVRAGNLRGIGLKISDYTAIDFIHKSGHSYRSMKKLRAEMGVDLVLEHLTTDDFAQLQHLRAHCPRAAAAV